MHIYKIVQHCRIFVYNYRSELSCSQLCIQSSASCQAYSYDISSTNCTYGMLPTPEGTIVLHPEATEGTMLNVKEPFTRETGEFHGLGGCTHVIFFLHPADPREIT